MWIYVKNIPAKFHPDPIWNDGSFGFLEDGRTDNKKKAQQQQQQQQDE